MTMHTIISTMMQPRMLMRFHLMSPPALSVGVTLLQTGWPGMKKCVQKLQTANGRFLIQESTEVLVLSLRNM